MRTRLCEVAGLAVEVDPEEGELIAYLLCPSPAPVVEVLRRLVEACEDGADGTTFPDLVRASRGYLDEGARSSLAGYFQLPSVVEPVVLRPHAPRRLAEDLQTAAAEISHRNLHPAPEAGWPEYGSHGAGGVLVGVVSDSGGGSWYVELRCEKKFYSRLPAAQARLLAAGLEEAVR